MKRPRKAPPLNLSAPCDIATAISGGGYGYVRRGPSMVLAHRAAWIEQVGPLQPGQQLHHACHDTACRQVRHLVLCANQAEHAALHASLRTHCTNGHERKAENLYEHEGVERCRLCRSDVSRKRRAA